MYHLITMTINSNSCELLALRLIFGCRRNNTAIIPDLGKTIDFSSVDSKHESNR